MTAVEAVKELQDRGSLSDLQKLNEVRACSEFATAAPRFQERKTMREPTSDTHSDVYGCFSRQSKGSATTKQQKEDREREGSVETTLYKSPKSDEKLEYWTKNIGIVHHQILKIKEEDWHLGEEIREGLSTKEKLAVLHLTSQMGSFIISRPILPSSPLSGKTAIKTIH